MEDKEKKIRLITGIYYSNPKVQESLLAFAKDREVVPRYFESFGKRPDIVQYYSDVSNLVKNGATSFHCSEELWEDPLQLGSEISTKEMHELRKGWDLLIDVDSKYFDVSKVLAKLIANELEKHGVKNYGIKFSGNKGFHLIVGDKAFPEEFDGMKKKEMFPEWPRAICEYLTHATRREFNKKIGELFGSLKIDKNEKSKEALCPNCGRAAKKGNLVMLECPICKTKVQRKDMKITKKRLKCVRDGCAGVFELIGEKDYFQCEHCQDVSSITLEKSGRGSEVYEEYANKYMNNEKIEEEHSGNYYGASDLVLVAPRHLFRMPFSLHEKTALASVVLDKNEIENFSPHDADPMNVKIKNFYPENEKNEAGRLLNIALEWKKGRDYAEKEIGEKKYKNIKYEEINFEKVDEKMFPPAIKKLLNGLEDGKKRGLFILLTFFRSLNYPPTEINKKIREWNEKNSPPLKEGYIRSQIDWHLKQKKKILPPNYSNDSFYRDLGLINEKPKTKNPLVDVSRTIRKSN